MCVRAQGKAAPLGANLRDLARPGSVHDVDGCRTHCQVTGALSIVRRDLGVVRARAAGCTFRGDQGHLMLMGARIITIRGDWGHRVRGQSILCVGGVPHQRRTRAAAAASAEKRHVELSTSARSPMYGPVAV